jgi:hypothetical protein
VLRKILTAATWFLLAASSYQWRSSKTMTDNPSEYLKAWTGKIISIVNCTREM